MVFKNKINSDLATIKTTEHVQFSDTMIIMRMIIQIIIMIVNENKIVLHSIVSSAVASVRHHMSDVSP